MAIGGLVTKEMKESATHIIYVEVQERSIKIWNPLLATHMHKDCYRVLEPNPDPDHEYWQFEAKDVVRCENYTFSEGEDGLIAVARCECDLNS